ncbi:L-seryl-tRNA(Sec) selenium transferase [Candidatus Koribacter versatilis Ellin345]|uniref:L-seryl-tRNA(Sec) selenium transferase n=1 Tax=Koribacter versatilis (strain Ellin345) TaxID=204669 RepID=Q1IHX9_KORVE|nr:L-seryl-tRNA(Sec) selenium transferase [Candidatus Koribacter versatilis]ABF43521.1 L-seryl-tRNA(Sec) selenium transferase [Candidatus Koribacter versatilis Ellin345]
MKAAAQSELYRLLPSVDEILRFEDVAKRIGADGRSAVTAAARDVLTNLRAEIANGSLDEQRLRFAIDGIGDAIERQLRKELTPSLRPVINAAGVILHTNLGRAPLSRAALEHSREVSVGYSNLEFDLEAGERGKRDIHVNRLFSRLLSSVDREVSTVVVNNNAAAVMLALNSLAEGGEVIVSRGELVEIGGSFRIPDVMSKSQASLCEVGTTNRTRIVDYEKAINERTRLLLRVHRSNFQIVGFTESPSLEELVALGKARGIPVMEDLGSGALFDLREVGIAQEPTIADSLRAGVDIVTYSGDKLLGGPQAGMLSGRKDLVAKIRSNPMFRALRVDKLIYGALEATLLSYVREDYDAIPALRFMRTPLEAIRKRADALARELTKQSSRLAVTVTEARTAIGGGSAPGATIPTFVLAVTFDGFSAHQLADALRRAETPIIVRVEDERVMLDLRTVFPEQDAQLLAALVNLAQQ